MNKVKKKKSISCIKDVRNIIVFLSFFFYWGSIYISLLNTFLSFRLNHTTLAFYFYFLSFKSYKSTFFCISIFTNYFSSLYFFPLPNGQLVYGLKLYWFLLILVLRLIIFELIIDESIFFLMLFSIIFLFFLVSKFLASQFSILLPVSNDQPTLLKARQGGLARFTTSIHLNLSMLILFIYFIFSKMNLQNKFPWSKKNIRWS